jgi:hypothetical protein
MPRQYGLCQAARYQLSPLFRRIIEPITTRPPDIMPQVLHKSFTPLLLLALLATSLVANAAPPRPFATTYNATYEGISAAAERSLVYDAASGQYTLASTVDLTLFGSSLTRIEERSEFLWVREQPLPQHYQFVQSGFGARARTVDFDHASKSAAFTVNDKSGTLMLDGPAFDDLSGYLAAKEQLAKGALEVRFNVVDRGEVREHHYKVVNRVVLDTPFGKINTVHIERVRGEDSARKTEIWLAPDHDYLLLKLLQTEPDGSVVSLNIRTATLDGQALTAETLAAASAVSDY